MRNKHTKHLAEQAADLQNLHLAFYKAAKAKQAKPEVVDYRQYLYPNLQQLREQILSGKVHLGDYRYFTIFEPKERLICAASFPERVLHHALMNVCHPFFENAQIYHSYATRIGKGTYSALDTAQKYARRNSHVLKLDVRKYFDSISHRILLTKLQTLFQDNILLQIFAQIIDSYGVHPQGFQNPEGVNIGLPIGNLTSQYFANFYLSEFDRFAKETLHCKHYVRYMDDIVVFGNTACELSKISETLTNFLQNNVNLRFKTNFINSTKHGVDFLGYRLFDNRTELA